MRSYTTLTRLAAMLTAGIFAISACTPARSPQPVADTSPADLGAPKPGGRVIVGSFADAKVLNPVLSTDVTSDDVHGRIYEALVELSPRTGEAAPRLAESFEASADGTSLVFKLRENLKWSDGSAFTGDDFKFTAEAVMRSKTSVRKNIFQEIVGAKEYAEGRAESIVGISVEGNAITVSLAQPFCPGVTSIGGFPIIPKSVFGKYMDPRDPSKNIDEAPENIRPTLATGPFKFKEWLPNDRLSLERNELFFGSKPNLDEWVLKVYPDATALGAALKTSELDVALIDPKDLEELRRVEALTVHSYPQTNYTYIQWNQLRGGKEFFQSKNVRQALAYGLNIDQVIEKVLFGEGQRMLSHTPPVLWAYDPEGLNNYKYDPAKAQQLLEQDGWTKGQDGVYQKGGQKLEFEIVTNSGNKVRETLLQVAVEQYKQIGVNVNPKTESFEALVDRLNKSKDATFGEQGGRDYDAMILGWANLNEPDAYSIWHSSQISNGFNRAGYKNEVVDRALEDGRTKCGQTERKSAYKIFNKQLNEDQPYNFGFAPNALLAVNKKFQGVEPGPFSRLAQWNIEKWWIK